MAALGIANGVIHSPNMATKDRKAAISWHGADIPQQLVAVLQASRGYEELAAGRAGPFATMLPRKTSGKSRQIRDKADGGRGKS
jgi:hypothetical protein